MLNYQAAVVLKQEIELKYKSKYVKRYLYISLLHSFPFVPTKTKTFIFASGIKGKLKTEL